jgi:hypothetical protein
MAEKAAPAKPDKARRSEAQPTRRSISIPIEWQGLDEAPTLFVNNFLIQNTGDEFFLTLCEVRPPLALSDEARTNIEKVISRALVRIALPPARLQQLIVLLTGHLNEYLEAGNQIPGAEEEEAQP